GAREERPLPNPDISPRRTCRDGRPAPADDGGTLARRLPTRRLRQERKRAAQLANERLAAFVEKALDRLETLLDDPDAAVALRGSGGSIECSAGRCSARNSRASTAGRSLSRASSRTRRRARFFAGSSPAVSSALPQGTGHTGKREGRAA